MKNNILITYIILAGLLSVTYLYIEKPEFDKVNNEFREAFIFNRSTIDRIDTKNLTISKNEKENKWIVHGLSLDITNHKKIHENISRIKKLRIIEKIKPIEYEFQFNDWFKLYSRGKILHEVWVGEKLKYDQAFYLKVIDQGVESIFLVKDESPQVDPIPDHLYKINPFKRKKLLSFLNYKKDDFFKLDFHLGKVHHVEIQRSLNKKIEIDFDKNHLVNRHFPNVQLDILKVENWANKFQKLQASRVQFYDSIILNNINKLGSIKIKYQGETKNYSIYLPPQVSAGGNVAVYSKGDEFFRYFNKNDLEILMPNLQQFLNKKIMNNKDVENINLTINAKNKKIQLKGIKRGDSIVFETRNSINETKYSDLIKVFFKEANYINFGREMTILDKDLFTATLDKRDFVLGYAHGIVEVFDDKNKLSYFFRDEETLEIFDRIRSE